MRGARITLEKTYKKRAPSSRLPKNVEASLRQLGEGETQDTETKSQTLVYDYDEHARSGSSLTLMTLQGLLLMHSLMHMLLACPLHVSRKSY